MAESKVKDDNYFMVSGWMLNRLNLKGIALQVFSIIYGFSQDGEGSFTGSLQYLCDFTNSSKNTVLKALKELVENGYIQKTENTINGVRFCTYKTNAPVVQKLNRGGAEIEPGGGSKIAPGGGAEIEPNNKSLDNKSLIDKEKEIIELYHSVCVSFSKIRAVSAKRRKAIRARLETYSIEDFRTLFEKAEASSFLKGVNDRGWSATFDWLIKEENMTKVLEGNYDEKPKRYGRKEPVPGWMEHSLGDAELEAIQRVLRDEPATVDPELAKRADELRRELQGGAL